MPQTILIVEDTHSAASTLEIALSSVGDVIAVPEGEAAWSCLQTRSDICAIFTDLQMPGLDGFGLIQRIRDDGRYDTLPIIVISGSTDPRVPARVAEMGASAFFSKPFSPARVRAKLEQLLDGTQFPIST